MITIFITSNTNFILEKICKVFILWECLTYQRFTLTRIKNLMSSLVILVVFFSSGQQMFVRVLRNWSFQLVYLVLQIHCRECCREFDILNIYTYLFKNIFPKYISERLISIQISSKGILTNCSFSEKLTDFFVI